MQLISNEIYLLPDGREMILRCSAEGLYFLHDQKLGVAAAPVYWINQDGKILFWGRPTPWHARDLRETGRFINQLPKMELL